MYVVVNIVWVFGGFVCLVSYGSFVGFVVIVIVIVIVGGFVYVGGYVVVWWGDTSRRGDKNSMASTSINGLG